MTPRPKQPLPHPPAGRDFREWVLTGFTYDVDSIYTSATNSKDHSEQLSFKVPPLFHALVQEFVAKYKELGYRSGSDFIRDALFHRMYQVMHREDDLGEPLWSKSLELMLAGDIERQQMEEALGQQLIDNTWTRVERCVADGWTGDAEDQIDRLHEVVTGWSKSDRRDAGLREIGEMRKYVERPEARRNVTRLNARRAQ